MTLRLHGNQFYDGLISEETLLVDLHLRDALDELVLKACPLVEHASPAFVNENQEVLKNNRRLFDWRVRRVRTPRSDVYPNYVLVPTNNRTTSLWFDGRVKELSTWLGMEASAYLIESKGLKYATDLAVVNLFCQLVKARRRTTALILRKDRLYDDLRMYGIRVNLPKEMILAAITMLTRMYRWEILL